jgi:TonB family protein
MFFRGVQILLFVLYGISVQSSDPSVTEINVPDTTNYVMDPRLSGDDKIVNVVSEASFIGIQTTSSASRSAHLKLLDANQIKRTPITSKNGLIGSKSIFRSQEALSWVINKHNKAIEYCYKKEVKTNPKLRGDLEVEFIIESSGRVIEVSIVKSSLYSKKIEKCISSRIRGWRFRAIDPKDGDFKVRQKYIFD